MSPLNDLTSSGQLSAAVLAALPDTGVLAFDADLRYVLAAGQALDRHWGSAQAMEGRTLGDVAPPELREILEPAYRSALAGEIVRLDHRSPDGTAVYRTDVAPIRENGRVVAGLAISRDVTESHMAAAAVERSERRYRMLAEQATDLISRHEADGTFLYASPAARALFGVEPEELVGTRAFDHHHPDDVARLRSLWGSVLTSFEPHKAEYRCRRRDGSYTWVESTVQRVYNEHTGAIEVAAVTRDVTERKRHEEDRERLLAVEREQLERLRDLDRLKDEFVSFVSHELRTPLTSIRGYVDLLIEYGQSFSDEERSFLETVRRNGERLNRLMEDLLTYFRFDSGEVALCVDRVDISELLRQAVESAGLAAVRKQLSLSSRLAADAAVVGDEDRLAQVIDNLLSNAIKYTPEGGEVEVALSADDASVVLSVADTGIGVPEEEREQLFERFFRASTATERSIPGTGLGLAITKRLVEGHGGTIAAEPRDPGTRFVVTLPRAAVVPSGDALDATSVA